MLTPEETHEARSAKTPAGECHQPQTAAREARPSPASAKPPEYRLQQTACASFPPSAQPQLSDMINTLQILTLC
jgi:hypothetical protein